jgi:quercetin dioxygenase-like cupin family protein
MRQCTLWATAVCFSLATLPCFAQSPEPAAMAFKPIADAMLGFHPALPACSTIAVQDGDPGKGSSVILLKVTAGCVLPWHWHTPNERLIIVSGSAKGEMKDMKPLMMKAGDYVVLPSKGIHQFTALTDVELYDMSDAAFDIHYVNGAGTEIPVGDALKAVHEAAAASK